ncbi:MAG: MFS transporter [Terriglobia bacterium]|jgi:MFS family permease
MTDSPPPRVFYGWWIVVAAFLNLFFAVGIVFYGFPVFYPSLIESLHFSRQQATTGMFLGFAAAAPLLGLLVGALIDGLGARLAILIGTGFVGASLFLMGGIHTLTQYYLLCFTEVLGYVSAGPIANQVLVANWFRKMRGRAMGYAYLGLGFGGAVSPLLVHWLIETSGWREAFEVIGVAIVAILFPIGIWVTRSAPRDLGLFPDGARPDPAAIGSAAPSRTTGEAVRTANFWLLLLGSTLVIGVIGTVISHFILFLKDEGYSSGWASRALSTLLFSSLAGRVMVGYIADRFNRKNVMALFYLTLALAIPLLFLHHHVRAVQGFAILFGFAMGADYMLIPLVAVDCFGLAALGKILALVIMADSLGQTFGPVMAGRIFDLRHSYDLAWLIITAAGILGAGAIFLISSTRTDTQPR